jgi:hypothetical protein
MNGLAAFGCAVLVVLVVLAVVVDRECVGAAGDSKGSMG